MKNCLSTISIMLFLSTFYSCNSASDKSSEGFENTKAESDTVINPSGIEIDATWILDSIRTNFSGLPKENNKVLLMNKRAAFTVNNSKDETILIKFVGPDIYKDDQSFAVILPSDVRLYPNENLMTIQIIREKQNDEISHIMHLTNDTIQVGTLGKTDIDFKFDGEVVFGRAFKSEYAPRKDLTLEFNYRNIPFRDMRK